MPAAAPSPTPKRAYLLIPFATLLVLHPLLIHGPSAGQDLAFHLQSWLDAAHQLRQGTLYPHWDITAAWNAGEPRFLFYPPISWMLGAVLTLIFPITLCPTIFIAIALLLSGLTFHKLASEFASPNAALIASTLYLANPYMLFTAFERSALAELLAAAWIPLLLLALLRPTPTDLPSSLRTLRNIAIPLALLWLTNAPAAVIGSYTLAFIATVRVLHSLIAQKSSSSRPEPSAPPLASSSRPERSGAERPLYSDQPATSPPRLALTYLAGAALGLTLPALYLLPAAYERKYVQTAMALLPNMRYQDNFLFTQTPDAAHNAVNHTISLLALTLLLLTAVAIVALFLTVKRSPKKPVILSEHNEPRGPEALHLIPTAGPFSSNNRVPQVPPLGPGLVEPLTLTLALLTLLIAFLLTPLSAPIWHHLPNLAYLQFPWRLLTLLTPILALSIALLLHSLKPSPSAQDPSAQDPSAQDPSAQDPGTPSVRAFADGWDASARGNLLTARTTTALTLFLPLALAVPAYRLYHQPPDPTDDPTHLAQLFSTHHGFPPTDEYTPTAADNDPLRSNNPAYWVVPLSGYQGANPNTPAPNTTPTAAELNPTLDTDDTPIPDTQTLSTPAPHRLTLTLTQPSFLILNLRNYPNWQFTTTCEHCLLFNSFFIPIDRDDGLVALALPAGNTSIDITWRRSLDQTLGLLLTTLALLSLAFTFRLPRPAR